MEMRLSCACGRSFVFTEGSADVTFACSCTRTIHVPPYRRGLALLVRGPERRSADDFPPELLVVLVIAIFALGSIFLSSTLLWFAAARLVGVGALLALAGYTWLIFFMTWECHPEALVWTFLFPCVTWYFAYQRWDIARWPFLCNIGGLILFFFAEFRLI